DGTALLDRLADSIDVEGSLARFDSIVSDSCMPGYTAIDILTGIRRYLPDTPVVLITGLADRHTHERAQQLGAVAVFDTAVDLDVLCTAVRNVISARGGPTSLGEPRRRSLDVPVGLPLSQVEFFLVCARRMRHVRRIA